MPPGGVEFRRRDEILSFGEIEEFTRVAVTAGISRVRLTGGEPLVRRDCGELVARLTAIPGIADLSLTTNGSLLASHAAELRQAGLTRINISINSLDPDRFAAVTGSASLEPVRQGLDAALREGFSPVKVNVVMLAGVEEELDAYIGLVRALPVHLRFIECMPLGRLAPGSWDFVPRDQVLSRLGEYGELAPAPSPGGAGPASYFRLAGAAGTIGFISAMSDHFCGSCNRIRLTAEGRLRNCLFSAEEEDIRPLIGGDRDQLRAAIIASMNSKKYDLRQVSPGARTMSQLGG